MNVGPVYHPIPPGADLITQLSYHLEHLSIRTEGSIHFLFVAVPPVFTLLCLGLARVIPFGPARFGLRFLAVAAPLVALRPFLYSTWILSPWLLMLFALCAFPFASRKTTAFAEKLFRSLVACTFFMAALPFLNIAATFNQVDRCNILAQEPAVRPLFSLCDPGWRETFSDLLHVHPKKLGPYTEPRSIFLSSDSLHVFAGFGYEDESNPQVFLAIDRETALPVHAEATHTVFRGFCVPSGHRCVTVHPFESGLRLLNDEDFTWHNPIPLPFKARFFAIAGDADALMFPGSTLNQLATLDLHSFEIRNHSTPGPLWVPPSAVAYDAVLGRLFMVGEYHSRSFLKYADRPSYKVRGVALSWKDYLRSLGTSVGLALDSTRREVYAGMTFTGDIMIYDMDSLVEKARIRLEPGLRELTYDPTRRWLYAGNYLSGRVHVVDMASRAEQTPVFVGRRIRQMAYEPRINRVLVTSANGFFEIDPGKIGP